MSTKNNPIIDNLEINGFIQLPDFDYLQRIVKRSGDRRAVELLQELFVQGYNLGKNNGWVHDRELSLQELAKRDQELYLDE